MKLIGLYHNGGSDFGGIYENGSQTPWECSPITEAVEVLNVSNTGRRCIIVTRDRVTGGKYVYTVDLDTCAVINIS
jgi:hypothetical protein